ncbi:MAG: MFS transporter [Reyranella sp.]|nr:MFS transporter [Reyranella sp.]
MATAPVSESWKVVWIAFVVAVFGWGLGFYGPAVYLPTLHATRGWPIATLSMAITAHYLLSAVLIAGLPDAYRRFGVGRVTIAGAMLAGSGAIVWANAQEPWQLVPALTLSGAGWAATSGAALNAMVAPWFDRDRRKAISMAFNGASVGGIVFAPLWIGLISIIDLSWTAWALAIAMMVVVCPLAHFHLKAPPVTTRATSAMAPSSRATLIHQWAFVTMSAAFALGLFAQIGLFAHLIARLAPDFGSGAAAAAISGITFCAILGRTLLGWLLGQRDRRVATAASLAMQAMGSLLLAFGSGDAPLLLGCILFGLRVGNLTSLPPLIAQREFRSADVGTVVALVVAINQAVFAFAPAIFGWLRDATGSYIAAFCLAAAAQLAAALIVVAS